MKKLLLLMTVLTLVGCGKDVTVDRFSKSIECGEGSHVRTWTFKQPSEVFSKMDLLFVLDTSISIWSEYRKITERIESYLNALPADADVNIALLPGHGLLSRHSGRLSSVLKTKGKSKAEIKQELSESFSKLPFDFTPGGGEYLFYSYLRATEGKNLQRIKKQGLLRDDAALTVVFVSDENDVCFDPRKHGYSSAPDFVHSGLGLDELGYELFCTDKQGREKYTSAAVKQRSIELKGEGRFSIGAVTHVDKSKVPIGKLYEDSVGHGYLQLLDAASPRSQAIEITSNDFKAELESLAHIGSGDSLLTRFVLGLLSKTELESLFVQVDGAAVPFQLSIAADVDEPKVTLVLGDENAGKFGSEVLVQACSENSGQTRKKRTTSGARIQNDTMSIKSSVSCLTINYGAYTSCRCILRSH